MIKGMHPKKAPMKTIINSLKMVLSYVVILAVAIYVYLFTISKFSLSSNLNDLILYATLIAIMIYSFESSRLRKAQQKSNSLFLEDLGNKKKERTMNLLNEFDKHIKFDFDYLMSYKTDRQKLVSAVELPYTEEEQKIAQRVNNVFSYFERVGLANKMSLINIEGFINNFCFVFPKFIEDDEIQKILEIQRSIDTRIWQEMLDLYKTFFMTKKS